MAKASTILDNDKIEQMLSSDNLSQLTPEQRSAYYMRVCESTGLNPYTRPFRYISLNGKLTLYATKDAADQLRQHHNISIDKLDIRFEDDWIIVTVGGHDNTSRTDSDIGVVNKKDMRGDFGNALMKAVTKAKRRLTLSICGLGMLDETEIETIPNAIPVTVDIPDDKISPEDQEDAIKSDVYGGENLSTMSLETARSVMSSDGRTYGEIEDSDPGKIDVMPIGINKGLKKAGLTADQYDEYMFKLSAIRTIQSGRKHEDNDE